ncbi:MAG: helix-turn-helix domain-containing protein [Candidatus Dojkabacteria bacterium]
MKNIEPVLKFLTQLGLDFFESKVYILLLEEGSKTILHISKESRINRTGVYRITERLKGMGIVEEIQKDNKRLMTAASLSKLELIVKEQETKAEILRKMLPEVSALISPDITSTQPGTSIQFFKGQVGVKHLLENVLNSTGEILSYTSNDLIEFTDVEFVESWRKEFINRRLFMREIVGDYFLKLRSVDDVKISNIASNFKTKYLEEDVLKIHLHTIVFNNSVSIIYIHDAEAYAVEIKNSTFAKAQKQLFELAWNSSREI